ncbi:hypothetical protein TB2_014341 [Malus domestica]
MSSPRSHCALVVLFLSLLFTRRLKDGSTQPMFTFEEALDFLLQNRRKIFKSSPGAIFQRVFRPAEKGEGEALSEDFQGAVDSQGHNAAICKTKWTSSGNITSGSYEFIDVVPVQSGSSMWQSRYFVDLDFAAQFEIAPVLQRLPGIARSSLLLTANNSELGVPGKIARCSSCIDSRKTLNLREVEEKLQVLNQKKHNLVQVLKQILNAEEEINEIVCNKWWFARLLSSSSATADSATGVQ